MRAYFASGHAIDVILIIVAFEAIALFMLRRPGFSALDVIGQLLAGALLLVAVRCALTGADYRWTCLFLIASLPAHLFDMARRLRSAHGSEYRLDVRPPAPSR